MIIEGPIVACTMCTVYNLYNLLPVVCVSHLPDIQFIPVPYIPPVPAYDGPQSYDLNNPDSTTTKVQVLHVTPDSSKTEDFTDSSDDDIPTIQAGKPLVITNKRGISRHLVEYFSSSKSKVNLFPLHHLQVFICICPVFQIGSLPC